MTEDTEKATDRLVSRREALAGGTLAAGLLALAGDSEPAAASHTEPTDNLIELGDSFVLFDAGDDAVIKHKPSGAEFVYNQAQSRWELDAALDLGSQDLSGVGALTADDGTVGSDQILGGPTTTSSISPGFGAWTTADANKPSLLYINCRAETDGTTEGRIDINIDESGGTTDDYGNNTIVWADPGLGDGGQDYDSDLFYLPAGAQFRVRNNSDPNNNNVLAVVRKAVL